MEKSVVLPLSGEEVREAILFNVNESLLKTCHLGDTCAYTAFRAEVTVKLVLVDYGREQPDNHVVTVSEGDVSSGTVVEHAFEIPAAPPNQVRTETNQPVPVETVLDGKRAIKKVKYQARRREV